LRESKNQLIPFFQSEVEKRSFIHSWLFPNILYCNSFLIIYLSGFIEKGIETNFSPISMFFENTIAPLFVNASNLVLKAEN